MNAITSEKAMQQHSDAHTHEWVKICNADNLLPDTGICALVKKQQIAIFRSRRLNEFFAVSNYDPIGEANVVSRGIIGSIGDAVVVASPLFKQHFNLRTGECLEKPEYQLKTYNLRLQNDWIEVRI